MRIAIPKLSLVVLIGSSGSGKSTFARRHFLPTEILSSDVCRGWVADEPTDQAATKDAFEVLHHIAGKRLARGRLTVVDATNVQPESRAPLVRHSNPWQVGWQATGRSMPLWSSPRLRRREGERRTVRSGLPAVLLAGRIA